MIIHDGKTDMTKKEKTPNQAGTSYGGFASMLEYEAYKRKKMQTGRKTLLLTLLLCVAFALFVGALLFVLFYQGLHAQNNGGQSADGSEVLASSDDSNTVETDMNSTGTQLKNDTQEPGSDESSNEETTVSDSQTADTTAPAYDISQYMSEGNLPVDDEDEVNSSCRIGITCVNITEKEAALYRVPKGVLVYTISPQSSAFKNGLLKGDIIESFNGVRIYTMKELITLKQRYCSGDAVRITVYRGDSEHSIFFTLDPASAE